MIDYRVKNKCCDLDEKYIDLINVNFHLPMILDTIDEIAVIEDDNKLYLYNFDKDICYNIIDIFNNSTEVNVFVKNDFVCIVQFVYSRNIKDYTLKKVICNIYNIQNNEKIKETIIEKEIDDLFINIPILSANNIIKFVDKNYILIYKNNSVFVVDMFNETNDIYFCKRNIFIPIDKDKSEDHAYMLGYETIDVKITNTIVERNDKNLILKLYFSQNGYLFFKKSFIDNRPPVFHCMENNKVCENRK